MLLDEQRVLALQEVALNMFYSLVNSWLKHLKGLTKGTQLLVGTKGKNPVVL